MHGSTNSERPAAGDADRLLVSLFGGVTLRDRHGTPIDIGNDKMRTLIGLVGIEPDRMHDRDAISQLLWPGRFPAQARGSLRQCLYDLGRLLEPFGGSILTTTRTAIGLDRTRAITDLGGILELLSSGDLAAATALIDAAGGAPLLGALRDGADRADRLAALRDAAEGRLQAAIRDAVDRADPGQANAAQTLAAIAARRVAPRAPVAHAAPHAQTGRRPGSYSVAVLPFESDGSLSIADEIGREMTGRLARSPHLHVAAYEACPPRSDRPLDIVDTADRLGVRYLVTGAMATGRTRSNLRLALIDGATRRHLWSKRVDLPNDLPEDLGFIADLTTAVLCEMQIAEGTSPRTTGGDPVDGFAVVLKTEMLRRIYARERAQEIVAHLSDLIAREPDNPTGHAYIAAQFAQNVISQFYEDRDADTRRALAHAERALALAPLAPEVLEANGIVHAMLGDCPTAVRFLERALDRNPDNPHTLAMLGWQKCWLHADPAPIELIRQAEARAPQHPRMANWAHYRASSLLKVGRLDEALAAHQDCYDRNPNYHYPMVFGAALLAHLGRDEEARITLGRALHLAPYYDVEDFLRQPADFPYCWNATLSGATVRAALLRIWRTLA